MPVSVNNNTELQLDVPHQPKRKVKLTSEMVNDAFIELHSAKGVTLKQIYSFILGNYNLNSLSQSRINLIKKHIIALRDTEDIVNKTGRGFLGHLKLVDKKKFEKKIKEAREKLDAARKLARQIKNANKTMILNNKIALVIPRQVTPPLLRKNNASMFDTPMVASQVHTSTPFNNAGNVPLAPQVTHRVNRKRVPVEERDTPRSSLPSKKRRLLKRPE